MTSPTVNRTMGKTGQEDKSPVETLSDRELQVFELIGQGKHRQWAMMTLRRGRTTL